MQLQIFLFTVNGILLMDNSNSSNNVPVPPPEIHCSHQVASGSGQDEGEHNIDIVYS